MTMNTGDVCRRIGITITSELLEELGFKPVGRDKRAVLWDEDEYPAMCDALGKHIIGKKAVPMQARPEPKPRKPKDEAPKVSASKTATPPAVDDDEEL